MACASLAIGIDNAADMWQPTSASLQPRDVMGSVMGQLVDAGSPGRPGLIALDAPKAQDMPFDAEPQGPLTLPEALDLSLRRSDELQQASARSARRVALSTLGRYGPRLDIRYQGEREHSESSGEAASISPIELPYHIRANESVTLRQAILDSPALDAYRRDNRLAAAETENEAQTRVNITVDVANPYSAGAAAWPMPDASSLNRIIRSSRE